jgi:hypothetical protein
MLWYAATICGVKPQVIIRQHGSLLFYYAMKDRKVFRGALDINVVRGFNTENTVYLYEPLSLTAEPLVTGNMIKTVITVSPNTVRYKEFAKMIGQRFLYMPTFSLVELLAIGAFMREELKKSGTLNDATELYSPEAIEQRYYEYGGIIRRVLPSDNEEAVANSQAQKRAYIGVDLHLALREINSAQEISEVGSYIVHWSAQRSLKSVTGRDERILEFVTEDESSQDFDPTLWTWDFTKVSYEFASAQTRQMIKSRFDDLSMKDQQLLLCKLWRAHRQSPIIPPLFENYSVLAVKKSRKLTKKVHGYRRFAEMRTRRLYVLPEGTPAAEAYYKDKHNRLHLIQVSNTQDYKSCTNGALADLFKSIDYQPDEANPVPVEIIYCRLHNTSDWTIYMQTYASKTKEAEALKDYPWLNEASLCTKDWFNLTNVDFAENMAIQKETVSEKINIRLSKEKH